MRLPALMLLLLSSSACAAKPLSTEEIRSERLADLKAATDKCGLPVDALKLVGLDELHVQPSPDTPYERVDCLLAELKKLPYTLDMGFVGNAALEPEEK